MTSYPFTEPGRHSFPAPPSEPPAYATTGSAQPDFHRGHSWAPPRQAPPPPQPQPLQPQWAAPTPPPAFTPEPEAPSGAVPGVREESESEFLTSAASRMRSATLGHAHHALTDMGKSAEEIGPHALLILSADVERGPGPQGLLADINCASRLFHVDEADDMLVMLQQLTDLVRSRTAQAREDGRLFNQLSVGRQTALAREALNERRWEPGRQPFPYEQALRKNLIWDPRNPMTGIVGGVDRPLSATTNYVGIAVTTLDTDSVSWTAAKHRYTGRDPVTGLPFTAEQLPAQAWAWLHSGVAMHLQRGMGNERRGCRIRANRRLAPGIDSFWQVALMPSLVRETPRMSAGGAHHGTLTSQELWQHLDALHLALADALDRHDA